MMKESINLARATMQSLALCPFFIVISDESKVSKVNIATLSYVGVLSEVPPIIGVSLRPSRHSHGLIMEAREFTLNLPKISMLGDLDYCGSVSGRKHDKATEQKIDFEKSEIVSVPVISACPVNLECRLKDVLFLSKAGASHDYFIADIVAFRRSAEFVLEEQPVIVTTNYDYREVGIKLGRAFRTWQKKQ